MVLTKLSAFVIFTFLITVIYGDVCTKRDACSCVFPNGTGVDLTPSRTTNFFDSRSFTADTNYTLIHYLFHPCTDEKLNTSEPHKTSTCEVPLMLCSYNVDFSFENGTYIKGEGSYNYLGKASTMNFSPDGLSIIYDNGPSSTVMQLICAESEDKLHVMDESEPNNVVLGFYSKNACLKQIEDVSGRSFGSTLLIIFFSLAIFYIVLGVCTKKFLMGATGVEVIPNLAFWSDLPNLVRDGWAFMISGFKVPARGSGPAPPSDPNSYDSI